MNFEAMQKFYGLARAFAEKVWDTMLESLVSKEEMQRRLRWMSCIAKRGAALSKSHWETPLNAI